MNKSKVYLVLSWVFAALLGILFLLAGVGKLTGQATEAFANWGYPSWFATFIGAAEAAGGIGLLIPQLTRFAIIGLTLVMFGAAYTHLANGEGAAVLRPIIFLVFLWLTWFFRTSALPPIKAPTMTE
jgi:putative oxidoreductase